MNSAHIVYRQGITPEQARDARIRALCFVFDCHARKKGGAEHTAEDDPKEMKGDRDAIRSIQPQ
jgi:hypothetical protein